MDRPIRVFICTILLLLTVIRTYSIVLHDPVLGYADQADFGRLLVAFQLRKDNLSDSGLEADRSRPIVRYRFSANEGEGIGLLSSQQILIAAAIAASTVWEKIKNADTQYIDIRSIGVIHGALFCSLLFIWVFGLFGKAWTALVVILCAAVGFLCDPLNILYFNTFYAYPAALLGVLAWIVLMSWEITRPISFLTLLLFGCMCLLFLGTSREQMMGLPVVFSLLFLGITSRSRRERLSLFLAFVVCGGVSVEFWNLNRKYSRFAENITIINRTNLTFGSMLPFHRDRNAALRSVGLPESCADFIGMDAYNPIMSEVPCKEIHSVSHADIVFALLREPLFFAQYLGHGLFKVRDPLLAILGKVSEPNYPHQPWSVYSFWDDIRDYNRVFLLCVAMFLGVASVPRWKRDVLLSLDKKVLDMVSLLAAATVAYTYVSAVLGDGYIALNQHFHLGFAFLPFCFLSVVFYLLGKLFRCFPRDHEKSQQ